MVLSIIYGVARSLLGAVTVLARRDVSRDAELLVLRHENALLRRRQVARVRYSPADRVRLAALARLIQRRRWAQVFSVTPATIVVRHRPPIGGQEVDLRRSTRTGTPADRGSDQAVGHSHSAGEPGLGHRRIQGELLRPGHRIAASTVWQIPTKAGIDPAPRRSGPTWKQFLTAQAKGILAVDLLDVSGSISRLRS